MVLWGIVHGFGAVYAYHRYGVDYATVIEEVPVFSAPDPKASVLFHQLPGALVKIRNIKEKFFHIENTEKLGGWVPVQALIPVKASSLK